MTTDVSASNGQIYQTIELKCGVLEPPLSWSFTATTKFKLGAWVQENRADILFNCPWSNDVSTLISEFLTSASQIQLAGSYAFVGITEPDAYVDAYNIGGFVYPEKIKPLQVNESSDQLFLGRVVVPVIEDALAALAVQEYGETNALPALL
ncbi:hypothetical protein BJ741DRAFT_581133 [Chytriomyces cf. hyalinus JEL632]|nr:hypothetical protein BJ741DRAFT_581133 [Chytriomyces cf. hyalinus JEL632]